MKRGEEKKITIKGLNKQVLNLHGKPFPRDGATFGDSLFDLLGRPFQGQTQEQKFEAYDMMKSLRIPSATMQMTESEVELIKTIATNTCPPEYCGVICDIMDNAGIELPLAGIELPPAGDAQ